MLDLTPRLADPFVRELLSLSIGFSTPATVDDVCQRYLHEAGRVLVGYELDGALVGCIGIEIAAPAEGVIHHIAVLTERQRQGIGRVMVGQMLSLFSLGRLTAETDGDAVGFYRRCGFNVASLGEQYPGVERFRCVLEFRL